MKSRLLTLWTVVLTASSLALLWSSGRAAVATGELSDASGRYAVVWDQAAELDRLRASALLTEDPAAPGEVLPQRVSEVLRVSGLPSSTIGSFDAGGAVR